MFGIKEILHNKNVKSGSLYLFASLFNKGIAFLTVPIFTRLLTTSDYGIVTTYSACSAILVSVIGLQLQVAIRVSRGRVSEVNISKFRELSDIFSFTLIWSLVLILGLFVVHVFVPFSLSMCVCCVLEAEFTAIINDFLCYLMMEYKYIGRTIILILPNLMAAIISIILILNMRQNQYWGRIIALSGSHIIVGFFICYFVFRQEKFGIDFTYIKWALKTTVPLIVHGVAITFLSQIDRTMISLYRGTSETGIYSLIYSFSMIAMVFTTGLDGVWVPWFTDKMNHEDYQEISNKSKKYIELMTFFLVILIIISPEILKIMAPVDYWSGMNIIPPLVISNFAIFAYTLYVNIEYYYEKTIFITINTLIAAFVNFILNMVFVPQYGYFAAAYTTLIAYSISWILHLRYAYKLNKCIEIKNFIYPIFLLCISTVIFYRWNDEIVLRWSFGILFTVLCYIKNKDYFNLKKNFF